MDAGRIAITASGTPGPDVVTEGYLWSAATPLAADWSSPPGPTRRASVGVHVLDPAMLGDHIDRLYRAAWSLCGSREEAEDLVQETFARVLRKPRILHSEDEVGYLLRVLRNTFLSGRRAASRRPQTVPLPETFDALEDRSAARPDARLESRHVYTLISTLPDSFRDALIAVDVVGLPYREAARRLGVPEATLTTRLHRGRHRVARSLAQITAG